MGPSSSQRRHRIFLAHLWLCAPFLFVWLYEPGVRGGLTDERVATMMVLVGGISAYLIGRTLVAWRGPDWPTWEYVCPPVDAALVSAMLALGDRDPLSNAALLYFVPLAEAAGTLRVAWAAAVAAWVILGAGLATSGFAGADPFNVAFRYAFLLVFASLIAWLAREAAALREALGVARDRNRIAMDMHDGLQGHLIGVAAQLELLKHTVRADPSRAEELAEQSRGSARQAADELRYLVQRMRAPSLAEGCVPALRQYASNLCARHGLDLEFEEGDAIPPLPFDTESALFRIAQEAMHNAVKHAQATRIQVTAGVERGAIIMTIGDNGRGFEASAVRPGAGLENMRRRCEAAGGALEIASSPAGTRVTATVAYREGPGGAA